MELSNFLANLVIPLNLCITLLVVAVALWMLRKRRAAATLAVCGLAWALFWSLPASSLWAGGRLEQRYPHHMAADLPVAQAIVVLGGNTANNRPNWFEPYDPQTATPRVDTAAHLYFARRAPLIVLSGAALDGTTSEAQVMANRLAQQGIPADALLLERQSLTTYENAVYTARKLRRRGVSEVLLVTSALHMPRSMAVFRKQGFSVAAAPAMPQITVPDDPSFSFWLPNARAFDASRSIIKEYVALLVYWLRGWT
ncbi:MAG: YdcF family protein [Candidimonas sp.]|jgi:uncharacterized SAM-binding protein YcdF (DUF218 family)